VEPCLASYARPPQRSVLACDDTAAPGQGAQEQARYERDEGGSCCLPLPRYAGRSGRLSTTLCTAQRFTGTQRLAVLPRLGQRRRPAGPATLVLWRGARPFASPEVRPWREAQAPLREGTGVTSHAVWPPLAPAGGAQATRAEERAGGKRTRFHATRSQAGTWSRSRRVVITVAGSAPGVQPRVVVTDLEQARTTVLYHHMDGARGHAENERKAHQRSLQSDRTSCPRCEAKQCRLVMHAAASG
jgi:hypothetical protein